MSNYTPGPWIAGDDEDSDYFLVGPHDGDELVTQPIVRLHHEYDARLIAAAPELLEALLEIVQAADGSGWEQLDPSFRNARAAIAKATQGETK